MPQDSPLIFISYRRKSATIYAGLFAEKLIAHFGDDKVFIDRGSIEIGEDFQRRILHALNSCEVLLAIIGHGWVGRSDLQGTRLWSLIGKRNGKRRIDDPNDYVRLEIATALKRGIRVIPILVEGANIPTAKELPEDLRRLSHCNGVLFSDLHWESGMAQLIEELQRVIDEAPMARLQRQREAENEESKRQAAERADRQRSYAEGEQQRLAAERSKIQRKIESTRLVRSIVQLFLLVVVIWLLPQSCKDYFKRTATKIASYASATPTPSPFSIPREPSIRLPPFATLLPTPTPKPTPPPFSNSIGMQFVWVASEYRGFYISKTPVTNAQWKSVMGSYLDQGFESVDPDRPVLNVQKRDVEGFIDKLNRIDKLLTHRIPTISEQLQSAPSSEPIAEGIGFRVVASLGPKSLSGTFNRKIQ